MCLNRALSYRSNINFAHFLILIQFFYRVMKMTNQKLYNIYDFTTILANDSRFNCSNKKKLSVTPFLSLEFYN